MKSFTISLLFILISPVLFGQCAIEHWSLDKRIQESTLVIEAQVVDQQCLWDANHHNIYTLNTLKVFKLFKGTLKSQTIILVTQGGIVGMEKHMANPSLHLNKSDIGVFLLSDNSIPFNNYSSLYRPTASFESFIQYDLINSKAFDTDGNFHSINHDLYESIKASTNEAYEVIEDFDAEKNRKKIKALANPVINSIDIDTVSAGTGALITISGSNFGIVRGVGKVGFRDANYGDGRFYYSPISSSYESWSNSTIEVYVPSRAGTGAIQVVNNNGESGTSSFNLYVKWAHINVLFGQGTSDTLFYPTSHISKNGSGGYTWQMTDNFAARTDAVKSFYRSLETWRCGTFMNWTVGEDTSYDQNASDNINIVRFSNLSGNTLGVCWSRWGGCYSGTTSQFYWYINELDIEFDSLYTWYYGTGSTPSGHYDFQSVATHELGHGHSLTHVVDNTKVMNYSIGPATRNADLSAFDIEGGEWVVDRSTASGVCGKSVLTALNSSICQITLPPAQFSISDTIVCPGDDVTFTNLTEGNSITYSWKFGSGSSTTTASTEGPHTISYSTSGTKNVRLIIENSFGKDTLIKQIEVLPASPESPTPFIDADTACIGETEYTVAKVTGADSYAWAVSSGGSFVGSATKRTVTVDWSTPGLKTLSVTAQNECGNSPVLKDSVEVIDFPTADFDETIDGVIVYFTSNSSNETEYEWNFGDGESSTEKDPSYQYGDKGDYTVELIASNQCGADTFEKNISLDFNVGIDELNPLDMVYPNPAKSLQVITIQGIKFDSYSIYDANSKEVVSAKLLSNKFQLPKLVDGIYVIHLNRSGTTQKVKLLIRNE